MSLRASGKCHVTSNCSSVTNAKIATARPTSRRRRRRGYGLPLMLRVPSSSRAAAVNTLLSNRLVRLTKRLPSTDVDRDAPRPMITHGYARTWAGSVLQGRSVLSVRTPSRLAQRERRPSSARNSRHAEVIEWAGPDFDPNDAKRAKLEADVAALAKLMTPRRRASAKPKQKQKRRKRSDD